jgi:hypothetical protein
MLLIDTKKQIHLACQAQISAKLESIQHRLQDIEESMAAETKSSVGDKYETGRAMLHLEKDKIMHQLATILQSNKALHQLPYHKTLDQALAGALVQTNKGTYYLGVSLGKISIDQKDYFVISLASPIGKLLFSRTVGDQFQFRNQNFQIEAIV